MTARFGLLALLEAKPGNGDQPTWPVRSAIALRHVAADLLATDTDIRPVDDIAVKESLANSPDHRNERRST